MLYSTNWKRCKYSRVGHIKKFWICQVLLHNVYSSFWPSYAIWRQRCWSTLAQVMACCLTAPSHYLNQCWLTISKVLWHSSEGITIRSEDTNQWMRLKIAFLKSPPDLTGTNELTFSYLNNNQSCIERFYHSTIRTPDSRLWTFCDRYGSKINDISILVQDRSNSIANALKLLQSCNNPSAVLVNHQYRHV